VLTLLLSGCLVNETLYAEERARLLGDRGDTASDGVDADGDGSVASADCDDRDADVYPGATETCDGVDEDCDGEVDVGAEDGTPAWPDRDGDGWGDAEGTSSVRCLPAVGWSDIAEDCDDTRARVYPGAPERLDGVRNDCEAGRADSLTVEDADAILVGEDADDGFGRGIVAGPDLNGDGVGGLVVGALPGGRPEVRLVDDLLDLRSLESVSRIGGWDGVTAPVWGVFGAAPSAMLWLPRRSDVARMVADGAANEVLTTLPVVTTELARRVTPAGEGELLVGSVGDVRRVVDPEAPWSAAIALGGVSGGVRLDAGGDVDGDGYDDVVVGMPDSDRVLVVGGDTLRGTAPLATLVGVAGEGAGTRVRVLGDLDGDGRAEVGVGAPFNDEVRRDAGRIYVVSGVNAVGTVALSDVAGWGVGGRGADDRLGQEFSILNLVGNPNLLMPLPLTVGGDVTRAGTVFLLNTVDAGDISLDDVSVILRGTEVDQSIGASHHVTDISGDGTNDIIITDTPIGFGRLMVFLLDD
jgi:hypothetical protein